MKKMTSNNIDWNKVIKVIVIGSLVVVIAIGSTMVFHQSILLNMLSSADVIVEGANFQLLEPTKIIEGAKFFLN